MIADFKNETLRDRILKSWHTTGAGRTVSPKVLEASSLTVAGSYIIIAGFPVHLLIPENDLLLCYFTERVFKR